MKIFGLVIMKEDDYNEEISSYTKKINDAEEYHKKYEAILIEDKKELEKKIVELQKENKDLTNSNISYKSSNTKLSNENQKLKEELANSYKRSELPADRTKSKQVSKVKSSSRTSRIAKMMSS